MNILSLKLCNNVTWCNIKYHYLIWLKCYNVELFESQILPKVSPNGAPKWFFQELKSFEPHVLGPWHTKCNKPSCLQIGMLDVQRVSFPWIQQIPSLLRQTARVARSDRIILLQFLNKEFGGITLLPILEICDKQKWHLPWVPQRQIFGKICGKMLEILVSCQKEAIIPLKRPVGCRCYMSSLKILWKLYLKGIQKLEAIYKKHQTLEVETGHPNLVNLRFPQIVESPQISHSGIKSRPCCSH